MANSYSTPRRSIRFPPDRLDHALIMYNANLKSFAPQDVGLILDQSHRGAQITLRKHDELALNLRVTVKLGRLDPQLATIVWIKEPDAELRRVGLEFVEP